MKISKMSPNFEVTNIRKTVAFYAENFGFNLIMAVPESQDGIDQTFAENKEYVYAMMQKDNVELMFQRSDTFKKRCYFFKRANNRCKCFILYGHVDGINEFYLNLKTSNLN